MNIKPGRGSLLLPGVSANAVNEVQDALERNEQFDAFFNDKGFHNHLMHHVLAAYSLGADANTIRKIYDKHAPMQRMKNDISLITVENWTTRLGKLDLHSSYYAFFLNEISENGVKNTIIKYIFKADEQQMLARMLGGLFHPFIHIGYGVEFKLPMMVADGLAQAACTSAYLSPLMKYLNHDNSNNFEGELQSLSLNGKSPYIKKPYFDMFHDMESKIFGGTLEILDVFKQAGEIEDTKFNHMEELDQDPHTVSTVIEICKKWENKRCYEWSDVVVKVTEILFLATILLSSTNKPGERYRQDFIICHILTSSMFLPILIDMLPIEYCFKLIHAYFRSIVVRWISRGRPALNITSVLMKATKAPSPTQNDNKKHHKKDENPWFSVMDHASTHHNDHVVKAIRTLCMYGQHFSHLPAFKSSDIDGTIFIRAAGILLTKMGWGEGDPTKGHSDWDF